MFNTVIFMLSCVVSFIVSDPSRGGGKGFNPFIIYVFIDAWRKKRFGYIGFFIGIKGNGVIFDKELKGLSISHSADFGKTIIFSSF